MKLFKRLFKYLLPCNEPKCKNSLFGCICGKTKKKEEAPPVAPAPTPKEVALQVSEAKAVTDPQEAQRSYDILTSPAYGAGPTTAFLENLRRQQFPLEENIRQSLGGVIQQGLTSPGDILAEQKGNLAAMQQAREDLYPEQTQMQNQLFRQIMSELQSPAGISSEQQAAQDRIRNLAQENLTRSLRERANLGGGLWGGRAQKSEELAVSDLQKQFAIEDINRQEKARQMAISNAWPILEQLRATSGEDINRQERERLNAMQSAIPFLQVLFPGVNITPPSFQSAAPSPESALSAALQARGQDVQSRGQDIEAQMAEAANQSSMWGDIFKTGGTIAGAAAGGPLGAALAAKMFSKPGAKKA